MIVTHAIAAGIGGCLGVLVTALCVAARDPQYHNNHSKRYYNLERRDNHE